MPFWSSRSARTKKKEFRFAIPLDAPPERPRRGGLGELLASLFARRPDPVAAINQLTPREREIALLAAQGYTNKEIADTLVIAPDTVKTHIRNLLTKLDLHSKADLRVFWAKREWDA